VKVVLATAIIGPKFSGLPSEQSTIGRAACAPLLLAPTAPAAVSSDRHRSPPIRVRMARFLLQSSVR
jgi:hypothetical protein